MDLGASGVGEGARCCGRAGTGHTGGGPAGGGIVDTS